MRLLGRDSELAACRLALDGRRTPAGVLISGDAGIGKTSLHRAAVHRATSAGWRVLSTTGLRSESAVPLTNLADLLEPAVHDVLPQLPAVQARALRQALRLTEAGDPPDTGLIARATVGAFRALAGERLLIAIDDEQWLDPDTRRLLGMTAAWLSDIPVGWLVSARSDGGLGSCLAHELGPLLVRLKLTALDAATLHAMILERFPGRWSPRLARQIVELAAGNPYTALELARQTLADAGRDAERARVPASLADSLRARLGRLDPLALAVVQAAALSPHPTRSLLRAISIQHFPASQNSVDMAVDQALDAEILDSAPPHPVLGFTHPLLREVAESTLSGPAWRRLHRALAAATDDQDEAAGHLAAGADEQDEELAATVTVAAQRMLARGAPARAAVLADKALALTPAKDGPAAWQRRLLLAQCLDLASEWPRARALCEKWSITAPTPIRGELSLRLAMMEPDMERSVELLRQGVADLRDLPAKAAEVNLQLAMVQGCVRLELTGSYVYTLEAVRQADLSGDPVMIRMARGSEARHAWLAGDPSAGERLRAAAALPGLEETPEAYYAPETPLGWWHFSRGDPDEARRVLLPVLEASRRRSREDHAHGMMIHLVEVEWRAGRWDEAADYAAAFDRYARETGLAQPGSARYITALVPGSRGEVDRARAVAGEGVRLAEAQGDRVWAAQCRFVLGQLELSVDDPVAALSWIEPLAEPFRSGGYVEPGLFPFRPDLVEACAAAGRIEQAADESRRLLADAARLDHPWARVTGGRSAAVLHLARREIDLAVSAAAAAVAEARTLTLPLELGRCLLMLGTAQRRSRRRREAGVTLDEAIEVLDGLGARSWAALARAQRARLAHSATDTLTPAEQRVAALVAQGRSNAEIAATMLISVKTVEANLTRIYRKLGVRSRVELARRA